MRRSRKPDGDEACVGYNGVSKAYERVLLRCWLTLNRDASSTLKLGID
jgi:hypothetical protein